MADGRRKPIEDIDVGDQAIATDPENWRARSQGCRAWVQEDTVTDLDLDLVVDGEVVTTTEDRPIWSVTDKRFERADELADGEMVLGADGRVVTVSGLKLGTAREAVAYNLTVEGTHTYHVGENEILAHNTCPSHGNSLDSPKLTTLSRLDDAD